jgi:2-hydroxychromene-2-carboxylate isomerase
MAGRAAVVDYFHQADDPYSHLAAQMIGPLRRRYGVAIRCWLVPPPGDAAAPERDRLRAYGVRDARRCAQRFGLAFPKDARLPDPDAVRAAQGVLAAALTHARFEDAAIEIGEALWSGAPVPKATAASEAKTAAALAAGEERRRRLGHYLGGMLHFEGEWYWGVDRLCHLEARLAAIGLDREPGPPLAPWRDAALLPPPMFPKRPLIETWFSFRSPYSWIAFPRLRRLAHHYGADLKIRFILPMVMRGLPVPRVKRIYITLDTRREADLCGLPYGCIVDPVGAGAARCLAVIHHAIPLGFGEDFAELAMRGAFADGIDLASDAGLFDVARRAGLTDDQTRAALADEGWREVAEANRLALFDAGLWGAPTFRVNGGPAHWGQDRIWALEEDLLATAARELPQPMAFP